MFAVLKHLFKLQFLIILIAVFAGVYYPEILEKIKSLIFELSTDNDPIAVEFNAQNQAQLFSKEALAEFNGEKEDQPIYLSVLGSVFDVSKGKKHYGTGCSYSYFAGRDASKSFVTGEFEEFDESSDDVMSLKPSEVLSLYDWKKFYDKEYTFMGFAVGRLIKKAIDLPSKRSFGFSHEVENMFLANFETNNIKNKLLTSFYNVWMEMKGIFEDSMSSNFEDSESAEESAYEGVNLEPSPARDQPCDRAPNPDDEYEISTLGRNIETNRIIASTTSPSLASARCRLSNKSEIVPEKKIIRAAYLQKLLQQREEEQEANARESFRFGKKSYSS